MARRKNAARPELKARCLRLESLENRELLAATSVNTEALFATALADANCSEIEITAPLALNNVYTINRELTITGANAGTGAPQMEINLSGNTSSGAAVFTVSNNATVTFANLSFSEKENYDSKAQEANAVVYSSVGTNVTISGCVFSSLVNVRGIYCAGGTLNVVNSTFVSNVDASVKPNGDNLPSYAGSSHGLAIYSAAGTTSITGSTFQENGSSTSSNGGAVYCAGSGTLDVENSTFVQNKGIIGGAVYFAGTTLTIKGETKFNGNSANENGGALFVNAQTATITDASFVQNTSSSQIYGGGAIYLASPTKAGRILTINGNSTFNGNSALNDGGAIYVGAIDADSFASTVNVNGATFDSNKTTNGNGGAIFVAYSKMIQPTVNVNDSRLLKNEARNGGAICNYGHVSVDASSSGTRFSENKASRYGGAYFGFGAFDVGKATNNVNVEFSNNTAGERGGAIYHTIRTDGSYTSGNLTCVNANFASNEAVKYGGAVANFSSKLSTFTSCVFTTNKATAGNGGAIVNGSSGNGKLGLLKTSSCVFVENSAIVGTTPLVGNTADNGGYGGAIFSSGSAIIDKSEFYGNAAFGAGALNALAGGTLRFLGLNKFAGNNANSAGGFAISASTTFETGAKFAYGSNELPMVYNTNSYGENTANYGPNVAVLYSLTTDGGGTLDSGSFDLSDPGSGVRAFTNVSTNSSVGVLSAATFDFAPEGETPETVLLSIDGNEYELAPGAEIALESLGLDGGKYNVAYRYRNADGSTSAYFDLRLNVYDPATLAVQKDVFPDERLVRFSFEATKDSGLAVQSWRLDWGDGTAIETTNLGNTWTTGRVYAENGTFTPTLTARYVDGTADVFEDFATLVFESQETVSAAVLEDATTPSVNLVDVAKSNEKTEKTLEKTENFVPTTERTTPRNERALRRRVFADAVAFAAKSDDCNFRADSDDASKENDLWNDEFIDAFGIF